MTTGDDETIWYLDKDGTSYDLTIWNSRFQRKSTEISSSSGWNPEAQKH
jgi:hypothetical protein